MQMRKWKREKGCTEWRESNTFAKEKFDQIHQNIKKVVERINNTVTVVNEIIKIIEYC